MNKQQQTTINTKTGVFIIILALIVISVISLIRAGGLPETDIGDNLDAGKVVMFSSTTCSYCKKVQELFKENDIAYLELNIDTSNKARALFDTIGGRGVPLTFIGDLRIEGYNKPALLSAIRQLKAR